MKYLGIAVGFLMSSGMAFAQERNDFKGPKAKNYKPWKHTIEATPVNVISDRSAIEIGPKAKNKQAVAAQEDVVVRETTPVLNNRRLGMVGPRAKNFKHYNN